MKASIVRRSLAFDPVGKKTLLAPVPSFFPSHFVGPNLVNNEPEEEKGTGIVDSQARQFVLHGSMERGRGKEGPKEGRKAEDLKAFKQRFPDTLSSSGALWRL